MASITFDISTYEAPKSGFDPLPAGEYQAIVTDSTMKITKAGTGEYLALSMQIIDGEHSGRKIWENLNIHNPNEDTERFSRENLRSLGLACGFEVLENSDVLNDIPFILVLGVDRKDPTRNRVKGYKPMSASSAPTAPAAFAKPWERK
jgi:hypothetical protein